MCRKTGCVSRSLITRRPSVTPIGRPPSGNASIRARSHRGDACEQTSWWVMIDVVMSQISSRIEWNGKGLEPQL